MIWHYILYVMFLTGGTVDQAVSWLLGDDLSVYWQEKDDEIILDGNPIERDELNSRKGANATNERKEFLVEWLKCLEENEGNHA